MTDTRWQTKASVEMLLERALMLKNIRAFFDANNIVEVETPLLSHYATTDPHLDSLQSRFRERPCYLNTSPEYAMKRLLASWKMPIYQIGKAFRDDELGDHHNPEFTILEWYRPDFDMRQLMAELTELVTTLCRLSGNTALKSPVFNELSYQQAFEKYAGFNPHQATPARCLQVAKENRVDIPQGLTTNSDELDDWLDWLLTQLVLPAFDKSGFTYLYDYPESQCALAKISENNQQIRVSKRFELFYGEIELANGFYELTDAEEQLARFKVENSARKENAKAEIVIDENFIAALNAGLPECSGVAVGLDRFLMVLTGVKSINKVLAFAWNNA